jgi:hypothetical protein
MGEQTFPEPPLAGSETETLLGSLERQRATFRWKVADLDEAGLSQRLGASALTLGRLLKHLAYLEDLNFHRDLGGGALPPPWSDQDVETRSTWALTSADLDPPTMLYRLWDEAVDRSRTAVAAALRTAGPAHTFRVHGQSVSLRRLLVDMIEEYGRHTGHADLLREAVDGRVGEDPPGRPSPYRQDAQLRVGEQDSDGRQVEHRR